MIFITQHIKNNNINSWVFFRSQKGYSKYYLVEKSQDVSRAWRRRGVFRNVFANLVVGKQPFVKNIVISPDVSFV